ncbi:MAG: type II secretion system F family protein, partial [Nanoarchaeota archaeon]|nr:type II secretion system F family protein [Nanoarchaeota archaeon]
WIGIISGLIVIGMDLIFFLKNDHLLYFLLGIAFSVIALPFVIGLTLENKKEQQINEMFLEFTRSLAESVASGTPVSRSIINMRKKNYGVLTPHIEKLANQIELGIPVDIAFQTFTRDVNSRVIKRAVALIREAERAGGDIDYILDSTAKSISEVEKLKKERKAAIYNLVVQGYIIFFIFIGIILVLQYKILPLTTDIGGFQSLTKGSVSSLEQNTPQSLEMQSIAITQFTRPFLYLLLAQGFFAGLIIGKLTEGSIKAGVKHSFILMITAFLVSTGSSLFLG